MVERPVLIAPPWLSHGFRCRDRFFRVSETQDFRLSNFFLKTVTF